MKIALSILIVAISIVPLHGVAATPPSDEEVKEVTDHYNMLWKYDMMATGEVYIKLGKALRVATLLKECKLDALAETVTPTEGQIDTLIMQYLKAQPGGESVFWEVRAAVKSSLFYYQAGFKDSAAPVHSSMGDRFCKGATENANDILRERKAAETKSQKSP